MKTTTKLSAVLCLFLLLPGMASAQLQPALRGDKHFITYVIDYGVTLQRGLTTADNTGVHYVPNGYPSVNDGNVLPEGFWNLYPLYFSGDRLDYCLSVTNNGKTPIGQSKAEVFQEYLNPDINGAAGLPIGTANRQAWNLGKLGAGKTVQVCGSFVPVGTAPAIAQSHLRISSGDLSESPGKLLVEDFFTSIWSFMPHP